MILEYRSCLTSRLQCLSNRHRVAFAALCAERQFGTYVYVSREDANLRPDVLRRAIDRSWDYVLGQKVVDTEFNELTEAVELLIPDLNEDTSEFASVVLDAVATVSYLLEACATGDVSSGVFAGECARNAVDEWVMGEIAPSTEGLPETIISVSPNEVDDLRKRVNSHPLMQRELHQQESDLIYLENHSVLTEKDVECLKCAWTNKTKSNIDLE